MYNKKFRDDVKFILKLPPLNEGVEWFDSENCLDVIAEIVMVRQTLDSKIPQSLPQVSDNQSSMMWAYTSQFFSFIKQCPMGSNTFMSLA